MALTPGTRLGPYEIQSPLGAGGMGQVYRATDTRLKRQVALKVLPAAVATDPERLSRFQREAEVLAALNHPNIAAIYGLEISDGVTALVMELVEGEDLSQRIARGAIPVDEAFSAAKQIAEALEAAHEQGIIHRDLKPANIKVRPDGTVKVLDFGLAKALEPVSVRGASAGTTAATNVSQLPTITSPAMTQAGIILGTAAYMSPEQARGKPVDKRADIWAFGCVLYEMLTGQRAFGGEDVSSTLAQVLEREPEWSRLPASLSPTLVAFLRRSLQKAPRHRLADMQDMRLALEGAFETEGAGWSARSPVHRPLWKRAVPVVVTAVVVGVAAALAARMSVPAEPRPVIRAVHWLPEGRPPIIGQGTQALAIAPGGERFVYSSGGFLYSKAMDDVDDRLLIQVTDAVYAQMPFLSPDGQSVGYVDGASGQLKRGGIGGGAPQVLAETSGKLVWGANWSTDGSVLFALDDGIWRVSENGGAPERLVATEAGEQAYGPQRLPGGEWILFTAARMLGVDPWNDADVVVASPATGERRVVRSGGFDARYVPTGHLVFVRGNVLYAVPFDLDRLTTTAEPVQVLRGVGGVRGYRGSAAFYAVSADGTLVYVPGGSTGSAVLAWTGLDGRQEVLDLPPGTYNHPRLSPDGRWLVFERSDGERTDVWVYQVSGTTAMRRLTEGGNNRYPIWSSDGLHVVFQSDRDGDSRIFWQRADGTAPAERLTMAEQGAQHIPESWSRTEDRLAFSVQAGSTSELWMWTLADRSARRFGNAQTLALFNAAFSPDGRWVAYTQRIQTPTVWVASVSAPDTRYQVGQNSDLAHHPLWSPDGRRLFYFAGVSPMAVDVTTEPTLALGRPVALPTLPLNISPQTELNHDIAPDGSRFITVLLGGPGEEAQRNQIITVFNWFEELRRLVPVN